MAGTTITGDSRPAQTALWGGSVGLCLSGRKSSRMNRVTGSQIIVGTIGIVTTYSVVPPGEYILELGWLRFDPSRAAIVGFGLLVIWGIATTSRRSRADCSESE